MVRVEGLLGCTSGVLTMVVHVSRGWLYYGLVSVIMSSVWGVDTSL